MYIASAQLLFCLLNILFRDVLVPVVVMVCLSSLLITSEQWQWWHLFSFMLKITENPSQLSDIRLENQKKADKTWAYRHFSVLGEQGRMMHERWFSCRKKNHTMPQLVSVKRDIDAPKLQLETTRNVFGCGKRKSSHYIINEIRIWKVAPVSNIKA